MASLQSATVVSLHGLTTISCHVGVDILYRDYNARERYGAPAGSCTSSLRLMPTICKPHSIAFRGGGYPSSSKASMR
jgi:hypothetical protein